MIHRTLLIAFGLVALSLESARAARPHTFAIPTPGSQPIAIVLGEDGNYWFTEANSSKVARITPQGAVTEFPLPTFSQPFAITRGPDGNVWFAEGANGQIAFITPDGQITEIQFANFDAAGGITAGPDGNIWFTDSTGNNIWRYTLATQTLTKFPIPTPNTFAEGITTGPDGNLWFTERTVNKIARITIAGVITEFVGAMEAPRSIVAGPDGNLWFNLAFDPLLGRITPAGEITFFPIPSRAEALARGNQNNFLITEFGSNRIAQVTTDGTVTESIEFPHSEPTGITAGPGRSVWFLGFQTNRVYSTVVPH